MKPKFNLAEFLAKPAEPNSFRRRKTRTFPPEPAAETAAPEKTAAPVPPKVRKP